MLSDLSFDIFPPPIPLTTTFPLLLALHARLNNVPGYAPLAAFLASETSLPLPPLTIFSTLYLLVTCALLSLLTTIQPSPYLPTHPPCVRCSPTDASPLLLIGSLSSGISHLATTLQATHSLGHETSNTALHSASDGTISAIHSLLYLPRPPANHITCRLSSCASPTPSLYSGGTPPTSTRRPAT